MKPLARTLKSYLLENEGWDRDILESKISNFIPLRNELNDLLSRTLVFPFRCSDIPEHVWNINYQGSYLEFIDSILQYMMTKKVNNTAVYGYKDPSFESDLVHNYFNPYTNFQANILRSNLWGCLFEIVGKRSFLKLLFCTKLYARAENGTYLQVSGKEHVYKYGRIPEKDIPNEFPANINTLLLNWEDILLSIVGDKGDARLHKLPSKYKGLKAIARQIQLNHRKCNYKAILQNITDRTYHSANIEGNNVGQVKQKRLEKTPIGVVIKFVLTIVGKIFESKIWGSRKNAAIVIKRTIEYIKYGDKVLDSDLGSINFFSIKSVPWIGKSHKVFTVEDLNMRKDIISKFLRWYFSGFIRSLLFKFWKPVTQSISGGKLQIDYFPIFQWKASSDKWINEYVESFLFKLREEFKHTDSLQNNFVGSIKLVPKTNGEFRLLCIPLRARPLSIDLNEKSESIRYNLYLKNFIKPLQCLLNLKDRNLSNSQIHAHPKSYSVRDVANHINDFRIKLINENRLDKFFIVKFDMEKCYDNMNQELLLEKVANLFQGDDEDKTYYIRRYHETYMFSNDKDRQKLICKTDNELQAFNFTEWDAENGIKLTNEFKALIDRKITNKLSKSDVISGIDDYIKNSSIFLKGNELQLYKRRKGLFQGFPLLATLCNIFYNQLVDQKLSFTFEDSHPSVLIRLVDDFIFISTSYELCQKVFGATSSPEFKEHGALVNEDKTSWIEGGSTSDTGSLSFVGLDIDTKGLTVKSSSIYDPRRLALEKCKTFKDLFHFLLWWYKIQLQEHVISLRFNSFNHQLDNLTEIWKILTTVLSILTNSLIKNGKSALSEEFSQFILDIIEITMVKWNHFNNNSPEISRVSSTLEEHFIKSGTSNNYIEEACSILQLIRQS